MLKLKFDLEYPRQHVDNFSSKCLHHASLVNHRKRPKLWPKSYICKIVRIHDWFEKLILVYDTKQWRKPKHIHSIHRLILNKSFVFITCPSTGSSCWSVARTKTAVLPIPDLAWHTISVPRIACGIDSCCTEKQIHRGSSCEFVCSNLLMDVRNHNPLSHEVIPV